jgi:hypothetical protein
MQMHRLPVDRLTDDQLVSVVNRAMLSHHRGFLYHALKAILVRDSCADKIDWSRLHRTMVELCAQSDRREEALHWLARARAIPPQNGSQFEFHWHWDMSELALRLENPDDPALKPLLDRFVSYYSPKVPQMRGHVERLLKVFGVPSPWDSISVVSADRVALGAGAVWTPDAPAAAAAPSKLWLPGQ